MKKYLSIFLIFFLLFSVSVPAFAETTSDVIPPVLNPLEYDSYLIYKDNTDYVCILYLNSDWDLYVPNSYIDNASFVGMSFYANSSSPNLLLKKTIPVSSYDSSSDNNGWGSFSNSQVSGGSGYGYNIDSEGNKRPSYFLSFVKSVFNVVDSSQSIYYGQLSDNNDFVVYSDTVFFYQPLTLEGATAEALTQFQIQMTQNLMIIVLCGVGCLAFLISLPILRKVLLRYLNR